MLVSTALPFRRLTSPYVLLLLSLTQNSSVANAALEAARDARAPLILQLSNGGAAFFGGKSLANDQQQASVSGAIAAANYIRGIAKEYGVPVILHSDHCAKKLLPWFDGMLKADEDHFAKFGEPLFSSHMLDLSEEPKHENIEICCKYLERMAKIGCWLEMEIGITGGEEDGVNNEHVHNSALYTQPEDIWDIYKAFSAITPNFSIAAAFGNVHGVYKPGNVVLRPELLKMHQDYVSEQLKTDKKNPVLLVFHGGSGSEKHEIAKAVEYGVVKMNVDTDTQYAFTRPVVDHMMRNYDGVLKIDGEVGVKKQYDPRTWGKSAEAGMAARVVEACERLGSAGTQMR